MAEKKGRLEIVRFQKHVPVVIFRKKGGSEDPLDRVLDHWHPELEIVYTFYGHAIHYIDGHPHKAYPGALFIVNSESIHKIIPDEDSKAQHSGDTVAVVLQIDRAFADNMIPDMKDSYFLPEADDPEEMKEELRIIFTVLGEEFADGKEILGCEWFHLMSYIDELLYLICKYRMVRKNDALPINSAKNLERLRGVIQWVQDHYKEDISQEFVANKFYFTKEYFARFFRKNTGMTFMEYVTRYRIGKAKEELMSSDKTVLDTAMDCGFSDARGLINAFRKYEGTTPLQFRKQYQYKNSITGS